MIQNADRAAARSRLRLIYDMQYEIDLHSEGGWGTPPFNGIGECTKGTDYCLSMAMANAVSVISAG